MIDILGTIYDPGTYDSEGNELTPPVAQEGYHVNTIILMPDMTPYQIIPTTPRRVFAGAETFCLKFADRAEWLALGYETTEDGEQMIDDSALVEQYKKIRGRINNLGILSTDLWEIPADAATPATVTYTSEDTVYFSVNEISHAVEPVDYVATLEVTADSPGPIRVEVKDKHLIITALEVTT